MAGQYRRWLDVVGDTDDVFYDAIDRRIYVCAGAGAVTMINQTNANKYKVVERLTTAPGARTSFFVPETKTLYGAVPHRVIRGPNFALIAPQLQNERLHAVQGRRSRSRPERLRFGKFYQYYEGLVLPRCPR
jgi:hypothetical protein